MVNSITHLETILQGKVELFNNCICDTCPCVPSILNLSNPAAGKLLKKKIIHIYLQVQN